MDNRGIEFGFGFLKQEASFDIQFSLIDYDGSRSYARAYLVGLLNTLLVSFIGIIWIYLSKIFIETKKRPFTIVKEIYNQHKKNP